MTAASTSRDVLDACWTVHPNPDVGGWRIVAHTAVGPVGVADLTYSREVAGRIADDHSRLRELLAALDGIHYPLGDPASEGNVWCACDRLWPCDTRIAADRAGGETARLVCRTPPVSVADPAARTAHEAAEALVEPRATPEWHPDRTTATGPLEPVPRCGKPGCYWPTGNLRIDLEPCDRPAGHGGECHWPVPADLPPEVLRPTQG